MLRNSQSMDRVRSIFSSFRLPVPFPIPTPPRPSLAAPCEITTEFFWDCGHTVTTRRCRNEACIWRDDGYHNPATACDATCPTRLLPVGLHMHLVCNWCRHGTNPPITDAVRSDPTQDVLDPAELERRRDFYTSQRRLMLTEAARRQFYLTVGKRALWEMYKKLEHMFAERQGYDFRGHTYFIGEGTDERLYIPIDRSSFQEDENPTCVICRLSLWEGDTPIRLPCHAAHHFHTDCIEGWLPFQRTCPHCRYEFSLFTYREWEALRADRPWERFFFSYRPEPGERDDGGRLIRRQGIAEWDPAVERQEIDNAWENFVREGLQNQ